jgi:hypothetical protein
MGWPAVIILLLVLFAAMVSFVYMAARTWRDYLVVAAIAALLVRPVLLFITDDVSRWLPTGLWSDGADGKDQVVAVGAVATLLLAIIGGSLIALIPKLLRGGAPK